MTQTERRKYLIGELIKENAEYKQLTISQIPQDEKAQENLLRSLFNVRPPAPVSSAFIKVQDEYLQEELRNKGVVDYMSLEEPEPDIYLWKGDITRLNTDGIVNAANDELLGCFVPCHACIDNAIHTSAGIQLRLACYEIMQKQRHKEKTGSAKITPAFNLPSKYVLHTVGPIVSGAVTEQDCMLLQSCYTSCLELARQHALKSIAFCCISTGEFRFPNDTAARIAVRTVKDYLHTVQSGIKVVFNVFKEQDERIYKALLRQH
ncbi:protein-ADP-ribose hydrolase [Treponema pedis]|uniref:protein-ADP-ribose hydrolase n=2 Tax=Treponema pedis TaxID=409322 RepID=UPI0004222E7B|nr:protein-ADP-ribose hydrolase [Treponema pedis]